MFQLQAEFSLSVPYTGLVLQLRYSLSWEHTPLASVPDQHLPILMLQLISVTRKDFSDLNPNNLIIFLHHQTCLFIFTVILPGL